MAGKKDDLPRNELARFPSSSPSFASFPFTAIISQNHNLPRLSIHSSRTLSVTYPMSPISNFIPSTFVGAPVDSSSSSSPPNPPPSPLAPHDEDCVSCRIIGGTTFAGIGGYAIYESIFQGVLKKGPKERRVTALAAMGSGQSLPPPRTNERRKEPRS